MWLFALLAPENVGNMMLMSVNSYDTSNKYLQTANGMKEQPSLYVCWRQPSGELHTYTLAATDKIYMLRSIHTSVNIEHIICAIDSSDSTVFDN